MPGQRLSTIVDHQHVVVLDEEVGSLIVGVTHFSREYGSSFRLHHTRLIYMIPNLGAIRSSQSVESLVQDFINFVTLSETERVNLAVEAIVILVVTVHNVPVARCLGLIKLRDYFSVWGSARGIIFRSRSWKLKALMFNKDTIHQIISVWCAIALTAYEFTIVILFAATSTRKILPTHRV